MKLATTRNRRFRNALGVSFGLVALVAAVGSSRSAVVTAAGAAQSERSLQQEADCVPAGIARRLRDARTGALRSIGTAAGRPVPHPSRSQASGSPEAAAQAYLSWCGPLFGLRDPNSELKVTRTAKADGRRSVVRMSQIHQGLPVIGGELVVHLDGTNNIIALAGKTLPGADIQTAAAIAAPTAAAAALNSVGKMHRVDPGALVASTPELSIYSPALLGWGLAAPQLVWRVEVTPIELLPIRELVLVDAIRGSVILQFNQIETARNRRTYTALNQPTLPGSLVCNESNPLCAGGDSHAVEAHRSASDTYGFYLTMHGRDSIDNAGMPITSTVHYSRSAGQPYANAFWDGSQMVYGDAFGFPLADDVVAHELTHGVTQYTSNLFYYYQSGAINESLSDVWGEFVDQTNGRGNDSAAVRWLVGEDVAGLGAGRSMSNPPAFGDPDRMTSPHYYTGAADSGGVHVNSGINNKAAFLMADGGTFNGRTISALGITKVAKIYYEVQTHLLTSGSDYADLYDALFQACNNLVGTSGITSADCQQVRSATIAVEMNLQPVPDFNPDAPVCPAGTTPSSVFSDNLESGLGKWVTTAAAGPVRWGYASGFAHSGRRHLFGDDFPAAVADSSVAMAYGATLPAGAFLHFAHAFAFELQSNYDGGVVEYSTNDGATWNDAGSLVDANGYTGTIQTGFGNPLGGRPAFVGDSHGYRSSRLRLSSLAGQNVRFRWRMGLDISGDLDGWWLDDVRIYTCANATIAASPSTVVPDGTITAAVAGGPGGLNDWVGLFSTAAADSSYLAWAYLNDTHTLPDSGITSATLHFAAPLTPGTYNLRLFTNGSTKIATSGTVTVLDVPTLSVSDVTVTEGQGATTATFNVTLTPPGSDPVTVDYATSNNSATAASDYIDAAGTLTFPAGTSAQTIAVTVVGDTAIESNETFFMNLSAPVGARVGRALGIATIVNDDFPPPPTLGVSSTSVSGGDPLTVSVANGPSARNDWVGLFPTAASDTAFVAWAYLSDTHTPPLAGTPGATLHFAAPRTVGTYHFRFFTAGYTRIATSATVTVAPPRPPVLGVSATLVNAGSPITATVTNGPANVDDWVGFYPQAAADTGYIAWAYLNDTHTMPPAGTATANLHFNAPMTPGTYDFRMFGPGFAKAATSPTVTVIVVPTLTINDVSTTEGDSGTTTATFTVALSPASAGAVSVDYATANGTAIAGADYTAVSGTLTFATGVLAQTVSVSINGDTTIEAAESFVVNLSAPSGAPIGRAQGVGTIGNDDLPPAPSVTVSPTNVNRGDAVTATIANGPANRNDWVGLFPSAAPDSGYVAWAYLSDTHVMPTSGLAGATLHFTAPTTPGTYDFRFFGPAFARLATSAPFTVAPPPPPALSVSTATGNAGDPITVTVTNGPANVDDWVGVYPLAAPDSGYVAWAYLNESHTMPTSGAAAAAIQFTLPGAPGDYNFRLFAPGFTRIATSTAVTVLAVPTLSVGDVSLTEGNGGSTTATFTVALSPAAGTTVTVNYGTANGTATAGVDYDAAVGTLTFAPGATSRTISVTVKGDTTSEPTETFVLNLSGASNAPIARTQGVGTIVNDDVPPPPAVSSAVASIEAGGPFTVTVANGPGLAQDWVGLFPTGASDGAFVAWLYLSDTHVPPGLGTSAATLHFLAPGTAGTYDLRFFTNGYTKLATSATVTVRPPP